MPVAYDGELVRMQSGRWARYQSVPAAGEPLLVAIEIDARHQAFLDAAEDSLARYRARGIAVQVRCSGGSVDVLVP
jgi:hypothetical protein